MSKAIPTLKIEGRSGCKLELVEQPEGIRVRKTSSSPSYNNRLLKQIEKQRSFNDTSMNTIGLYAPEVYEVNTQTTYTCFEMSYVSGLKYSDYFNKIGYKTLMQLIDCINSYFEVLLQTSCLTSAPSNIITSKIQELKALVKPNSIIKEELLVKLFSYLENAIPTTPLPIGKCHGDFTLSNMLFPKNGSIVVFDFLDSFIESPLVDIVKLKQDTKHHWSLHIEQLKPTSSTRLLQVLTKIDEETNQLFTKFPDFTPWYSYLEVFNFVRILPYAKSEDDYIYLNTVLKKLINQKS